MSYGANWVVNGSRTFKSNPNGKEATMHAVKLFRRRTSGKRFRRNSSRSSPRRLRRLVEYMEGALA